MTQIFNRDIKIMEIVKRLYFIQLFSFSLANIIMDPIKNDIIDGLRRSNGDDDRDVLLVLLPDTELRTKMTIKNDLEKNPLSVTENVDDELAIADLKLNKQQKEILRKRWRSSCDRKASKVCIKACRSTYKIVCGSYKCRRSMKRSFKRECRRNCKAKFVSSKYSDDE